MKKLTFSVIAKALAFGCTGLRSSADSGDSQLAWAPAKPFDAQHGEYDRVTDGTKKGYGRRMIPAAGLKAGSQNMLHGAIGRIFHQVSDLFSQHTQFTKHADHNKYKINQATGRMYCFRILN